MRIDSRDPIRVNNGAIINNEIQSKFIEYYPDATDPLQHDNTLPETLHKELTITEYVDSDHSHDKVTRRSITGLVIFIGKTPVYCLSKCQGNIETLTYRAEFNGMKKEVEEAMAVRYTLQCLGVPVKKSTNILGDNKSVILIMMKVTVMMVTIKMLMMIMTTMMTAKMVVTMMATTTNIATVMTMMTVMMAIMAKMATMKISTMMKAMMMMAMMMKETMVVMAITIVTMTTMMMMAMMMMVKMMIVSMMMATMGKMATMTTIAKMAMIATMTIMAAIVMMVTMEIMEMMEPMAMVATTRQSPWSKSLFCFWFSKKPIYDRTFA